MISAEEIEEIVVICPGAKALADGPLELVHLPNLSIKIDGQIIELKEALLCLTKHKGYSTRLYLSQSFPNKCRNWSTETIIGRVWHSCSWQGVPRSHRLSQVLAQHLRALR